MKIEISRLKMTLQNQKSREQNDSYLDFRSHLSCSTVKLNLKIFSGASQSFASFFKCVTSKNVQETTALK